MVAVIHASSSLRNCLNYNEQKLKTGDARLLEAGYYPMDGAQMTFHQKLARLEKLTSLNQRTRVNSVHISLNFDPSEKLSDELLREIAAVYLEKIGFAGQPYLLYQHLDAGHPHIHLVTTNIKPDGKAINLNNLGKNQSSAARREIEIAYGLVRAEDSQQREMFTLKPVNVERALYGRVETKRAIGGLLNSVLKNYKFTSLNELNAVLQLYNVTADAGSEGSRIREHEGLVYRVLDEQGNKVGVPIRASDFFSKPTLKNIREKFGPNETARVAHKGRLRNAIDLALLRGGMDMEGFKNALKKEGIDVVLRQNADGVIYGITYIDHVKKMVFNGSDLGKAYSAKAILERCGQGGASEEKNKPGEAEKVGRRRVGEDGWRSVNSNQNFAGEGKNITGPGVLETLLEPGYQPEVMDWQLKRKKKKKKQRVRID
ncbi:relaxase/mobilization nuclease domain-containing protein [Mucilaginibacter sp. L3T2-6]|uniref:relaxase/mobilization nuclease domain-containing protein n=1 Tax=Mucilaginibacter sp. L3T2-6 TaxID=3062491 RepID=UPI0026749EA3|nr:relaxase/mobilization nuclease domain-containing protein [Mucilaginibacter sp. L3T2-6]MDO3641350.1 relaxase/mobilization nuclease domain-containing protein [Mucilaginibacter sp. L3T2-6]MDV6213889.1 relaxase/mobilization nuclease domain-containing protein [Mucilaginibacter sp. L3T2-6]